MGCDIHLFVERKHKGKWTMMHEVRGEGRGRNYRLFAAIAGVRGDGPEPKGLPIDVSESTNLHADDEGGDGHSHSWMPLREAIEAWNTKRYVEGDNAPVEWPAHYWFEIYDDEIKDIDDYRVVFWFDN